MEKLERIISIILGDLEPIVFVAYVFVAYFSALVMLLYRADKKRKEAQNTPDKFSFKFFLQDNISTFLLNLLFIPLFIVLSNAFIGADATVYISFIIGITSNELVLRLEKFQSKARE